MLRIQEKPKNIASQSAPISKAKALETKAELPTIASISEVIQVKTNNRLDRTKNFLANEINYLELSAKSFGSGNKVQSMPSPPIKQNHESTDFSKSNPNSPVPDASDTSQNDLSHEHARIPCMNPDPKNKYSKFNNETKLSNSGEFKSDSVFSQRHVPIFLPLSPNLESGRADNEKDNYDDYVKRSSRRSKIVKLPMHYNDTSPEPSGNLHLPDI